MTKKKITIAYNWKPWEHFKQDQEILNIPAPPCSQCKFWNPQRKYIGTIYDGVQLCHASEMEHDFSWFRSKEIEP